MKRLSLLFLLAVVHLSLMLDLRAQTLPTNAAAVVPWNQLNGSRASPAFTTIFGLPGNEFISGSSAASPFGPTFSLALPFNVDFLDSTYLAGHMVRVGISGFLTFSSTTTTGATPYVLQPDPNFTRVLMPFWSNLGTNGLIDEGIYTYLHVDPITLDTVWTIEWRVEAMDPPNPRGNFQLSMIKHPPVPTGGKSYVEFRFDYDSLCGMATTTLTNPFGAQIGIKKLGQPIGPPPLITSNVDSNNYMLLTRSRLYPSMPCITRLPTRDHGGVPYTPDWYATYVTPASGFFHFTFPDSSFRMKPVDLDSRVVETGTESTVSPFTMATLNTSFRNVGTSTLYNVPYVIYILDGSLLLDSTLGLIDTLKPDQERPVPFMVPPLASGSYRMLAITQLIQDRDRSNDTGSRPIIVRADTDAMPLAITSPVLGSGSSYAVDSSIDLVGTVTVPGAQMSQIISYIATVTDASDSIVATFTDTLFVSGLLPDSVRSVTFGSWTPMSPGDYYLKVVVSTPGDELPANDTIVSVPGMLGTMLGSGGIRPTPLPFHVYPDYDLVADDPIVAPDLPHRGDTVVGATPVRVLFGNLGALDAPGVIPHVTIRNSMGAVVYDSTGDTVDMASRVARTLVLPDFTIPATDDYCAVAWLEYTIVDANPANDTAKWCFSGVAIPPKRAIASADDDGRRIVLRPNPASDYADLRFTGAVAGPVRVTVLDLLGTAVERIDRNDVIDGSVRIDLHGLPSGLYLLRVESGMDDIRVISLVVGR